MTYGFAAAGTGGHVYPALSVAEALVAAGVDRADIVFFGGDRMEATTVPRAGFEFHGVRILGLQRSLSLSNLRLPAVVWKATRGIASVMEARRVRVMSAFGGYVSVPAALAARRTHADLYIHEQNAVPGLANQLISRMARRAFVAFPETLGRLRKAELTGNPLRAVFDTFDRDALRAAARKRYDLDGNAVVLGVLGGSLGATVLNRVVADYVASSSVVEAVVHLTGRAHIDDVKQQSGSVQLPWRVLDFEDSMEYFYAASDVVLARAGALTVSELAVTGTPAIVVPYAAGTAGHQAANAAQLASVGGVEVVAERDVDAIPDLLDRMQRDQDRRAAMSRAALSVSRPNAAERIAKAILRGASAERAS